MALTLSPIQFIDSKLLHISFDDTSQKGLLELQSEPNVHNTEERYFALSVNRDLEYSEKAELLSCMGSLQFKWDVRVSEDSDSPLIASVEGAMGAVATCPLNLGDRELIEKTLAANTLSYIWAKLRTIVEQLSSQSTIGTLSLPAIDPLQLVGK